MSRSHVRIYSVLVLCSIMMLFMACRSDIAEARYYKIEGKTMGTTYACIYEFEEKGPQVKHGVDSVLELVNQIASTYLPTSLISQFNRSEKSFCVPEGDIQVDHMYNLIEKCKEIGEMTDGFFNPAVMPLVNYWGFGYTDKKMRLNVSPTEIDSLLQICDFKLIEQKIESGQYCLEKEFRSSELDMSAIAKGYAVDLVGQYLADMGCQNYYVNIGGEIVVRGKNDKGTLWTLGINYPDTAASLNEIFAIISLGNKSMASSGNYRNYYSNPETTYAHTINPKTGMAIPSDLLGVTIVAKDCATADALATACMAMGYERGRTLVDAHPELEGFFIYKEEGARSLNHYGTPALMQKIKINK